MTPKQTPKSEATRAHILTTALELFQEHGFEKTTMRMIASACGMALGAAYYYFRTKEDLVLHFYAETGAAAREHNREIVAGSKDFKTRMAALLEFKLVQMAPFRDLAAVLARQAADWGHPLSPFSPQSKPMRDEAIGLIEEVLDGSNFKASSAVRPHLAKMFWLYQMGIILFWVNDTSPEQKRTGELIALSLALLHRLVQATALPFMRAINEPIVQIVELVERTTAERESAS